MLFNLQSFVIMDKEKLFSISVALFLLSFASAIGSYWKTTYDIRHELSEAMHDFSSKFRDEMRIMYATKEETHFQYKTLVKIEQDVSSLHEKIDRLKSNRHK